MPRSISHVAFTAASFISLAVCLATLGLWLHSTQRLDRLRSGTSMRRISLHSKDGEVYIDLARASSPIFTPGYQHIHALPTQYRPPSARWEFAGLGAGSETVKTYQGMIDERFVEFPLWLVVVLSSVLPVLWFDVHGGQKEAPKSASPIAAPRSQPV
jgi:hypothetical protein